MEMYDLSQYGIVTGSAVETRDGIGLVVAIGLDEFNKLFLCDEGYSGEYKHLHSYPLRKDDVTLCAQNDVYPRFLVSYGDDKWIEYNAYDVMNGVLKLKKEVDSPNIDIDKEIEVAKLSYLFDEALKSRNFDDCKKIKRQIEKFLCTLAS